MLFVVVGGGWFGVCLLFEGVVWCFFWFGLWSLSVCGCLVDVICCCLLYLFVVVVDFYFVGVVCCGVFQVLFFVVCGEVFGFDFGGVGIVCVVDFDFEVVEVVD